LIYLFFDGKTQLPLLTGFFIMFCLWLCLFYVGKSVLCYAGGFLLCCKQQMWKRCKCKNLFQILTINCNNNQWLQLITNNPHDNFYLLLLLRLHLCGATTTYFSHWLLLPLMVKIWSKFLHLLGNWSLLSLPIYAPFGCI
jgi:hypothetical protein